jgi:hypothetical protein
MAKFLMRLTLVAASASLAVSIGRAQQGGGAPAARPPVPMAASSLLLNPDAHYGENVSLTAAVEAVLSKTAFTVDQDKDKTTGKEVLIVAPNMTGVVQLNTYVTIMGEVVKFDPSEVARKLKGYTLDLTSDVVAKFEGHPAVFATAVITPGLIDVAKRVLPPMTPAEQAYSKLMKGVGSAFPALRTGLDNSNASAAKENVAILKKSFADVQAFWKERNTADAVGWAQEASKHTDTIDAAVTAGKWDDAKTAAGSLQQLCTSCHTAYRERLDDGTYRIKSK